MSKKKISAEEPTPLCLKDVKFFATHYLYQYHGKEELSVSLIQRRYLIGYAIAVQVYSYIRGALELGQYAVQFGTAESQSDEKFVQLSLMTSCRFATLLARNKLSNAQSIQLTGDYARVTLILEDSPRLDLWLVANSHSILSSEKSSEPYL